MHETGQSWADSFRGQRFRTLKPTCGRAVFRWFTGIQHVAVCSLSPVANYGFGVTKTPTRE